MQKYLIAVFICFFLSSCFTRSSYMNRDNYDSIVIGATTAEVRQKAGEPLDTHSLSNGDEEYIYVEKITKGSQVIIENHYIIVFSNGRVVSKRTETNKPPAFNAIYENDPNFTQNY